ncbi:hypothetical protein B296_00036403, partial [Ensete ventricosum]
AAPRPWLPPTRAIASRSGCLQGEHPHKAALLAHEVMPKGSGAYYKGGCPRQRRATLLPAY